MKAVSFAVAALVAAIPAYAQVDVKTGGVGETARQELMSSYGDYNLHIAFAEKSGAYLADVDVTIRDAKGEQVWQGTTQGPLLFARVPPGRYTVAARFNGEEKRREVSAGSGPGKIQYVHWDLPGVPGPASAGR